MSYTNLKARLEAAREMIWVVLEDARDQLDEPEIPAEATRAVHDLHVKRLFAAHGLRSLVGAIDKIERTVDRDKFVMGSDAQITAFYERVVSFAEHVTGEEIRTFREANKAFDDAQN